MIKVLCEISEVRDISTPIGRGQTSADIGRGVPPPVDYKLQAEFTVRTAGTPEGCADLRELIGRATGRMCTLTIHD